MSNDKLDLPQDSDLGYGQLLSVLVRRSGWIGGALVISSLLAAYNSLQKEPTYMSSMQLLVEPNYREQFGAGQNAAGQTLIQNTPIEIDYATQIRVMQSSELLERAVNLLQGEYPDMTVSNLRDRLLVLRRTEIETADSNNETETSILQVDYTSNDPDKAQRVVAALQDVYLAYNLEQQDLRLQNGLAFINQQLPVVEQDVFQAEQSLEQFRENQNLIDPEQRAAELTAALDRVEQNRQQTQADLKEVQARYNILQQQLKETPQGPLVSSRLSESARYQNLLNSYQEIELALAEERVQFTDNSSYVRRLQRQLDNQKQLLGQEVERILGSSGISDNQLLLEGQFGDTDLAIARELGELQATMSGLVARDQGLAQVEQQIRGELARFPELIAQFTRLQPEIEIKRDTLQQLLRARQDISIDIARGGLNWQVIESAQPGIRTGPNLQADILLGGISGLFLGIILAFVREAMDNRLRTVKQIQQQTSIPVLGEIAYFSQSGWQASVAESLWQSSHITDATTLQILSWRPFRESLDLIYKNIQLLHSDSGSKSLAITSAIPREGKSTLVLGLATTAARLYQRVLLIDGNLRNPTIHSQLNLSIDRGLSTYLIGEDSQPLIHQVKIYDCEIDVLTAGRMSPDPTRLLGSRALKSLIKSFEKKYDLILVDTAAIIGTVDALQVASSCQDTVLVTRLRKTSEEELSQALSLLYRSNLIGIIANGSQSSKKSSIHYAEFSQELDPYTTKTEQTV